MQTVEYKGKRYNKYTKFWVDENYITVPISMQNELNYIYFQSLNKNDLSMRELIELGDEFKIMESYSLAIDTYLLVSEKGNEKEVKTILPRITACYRKVNRPDLVIDILAIAKKKHGKNILTPALLTSAAGAYCDMEKYQEARKCCDYALAMENGKGSHELLMVYKRINANISK